MPRSIHPHGILGERRYQLQKLGDVSSLADHQTHSEQDEDYSLRMVSGFPSFPMSRDNLSASAEILSKCYTQSPESPLPYRSVWFLPVPSRRAMGYR